jgi:lipopolysaccharide transport system ATP-binding protein
VSTTIRFDHVSKKFTLHRQRARSFQELALHLFGGDSPTTSHGRSREAFWALRDVSFTVDQGETVGLIGPNGAGKSTALKLVSRIIEPTTGKIEVSGRVGALLELGAGFHPDLSGRENIYLNGSILGLSRSEIQRKLDDIIAFAELDRFIDMPVRHYSSGMHVRLGFAVAVHTKPEILLVDEVLSVGDASFQKKCLDKIDQLRRQSVTILFVSHSASMVRNLCARAIWLDEGRIVVDGSTESVVARYLDHSRSEEGQSNFCTKDEGRWGSGQVLITNVRLLDRESQEKQHFHSEEPLIIEMHYWTEERVEQPVFGVAIHRSDGTHITGPNTQLAGQEIPWIEGEGVVKYIIPSLPLLEGSYLVSVAARNQEDTEIYDYHDRLYAFNVLDSQTRYGIIPIKGTWVYNGYTNSRSGSHKLL